MPIAISLVALALGYKVFADAHKEKEGLKLLGQIIGIVVMLAALLSILCGVAKCMYRSQCSMMPNGGCPFAARSNYPMGTTADSGK